MNLPTPRSPAELAPEARTRAEQEAAERDIPLDRLCVIATPFGIVDVIELDEDPGSDSS